MNRICILKATRKLLEMQGGGKVDRSFNDVCNEENKVANNKKWDELEAMRLNTLKQNALNAGYAEEDIEVKWISDEAWAVMQAELNKPTPEQIAEREKEVLIQAKIREQAISALKAEGKLTASGEFG